MTESLMINDLIDDESNQIHMLIYVLHDILTKSKKCHAGHHVTFRKAIFQGGRRTDVCRTGSQLLTIGTFDSSCLIIIIWIFCSHILRCKKFL